MSSAELISTAPATGAEIWRGMPGDVDAEVAIARAAWPEWASRPLAVRIEATRRFVNVARARLEAFADLIARETGKPLWEARTEVESVIAKVDIRSEEHTSELQSLMLISYAVFCLNKKNRITSL